MLHVEVNQEVNDLYIRHGDARVLLYFQDNFVDVFTYRDSDTFHASTNA